MASGAGTTWRDAVSAARKSDKNTAESPIRGDAALITHWRGHSVEAANPVSVLCLAFSRQHAPEELRLQQAIFADRAT